MKLENLDIEGCFLINNFVAHDTRGSFIKTFHAQWFADQGLQNEFKESYYSVSHQNVIRGMHFQLPPYDHEKLVYVTQGEIIDVVLDLRANSKMFGKCLSYPLKAMSHSIYIPKGCAHGFLTISPQATVVYQVSTVYAPDADRGILWNSFGFQWPVVTPILSERDASFPLFHEFKTPF